MNARIDQLEWRLDLDGLHCPTPIIHCKAALQLMSVGDNLHVVVTDRDALHEIPRLIDFSGQRLLGFETRDGAYHFHIKKISSGTKARRLQSHSRLMKQIAGWLAGDELLASLPA